MSKKLKDWEILIQKMNKWIIYEMELNINNKEVYQRLKKLDEMIGEADELLYSYDEQVEELEEENEELRENQKYVDEYTIYGVSRNDFQ